MPHSLECVGHVHQILERHLLQDPKEDCDWHSPVPLLPRRNPVKGVAALIASGSVQDSPEAVAAFLREHARSLDRYTFQEPL